MISLRGHHILCLPGFRGLGYSAQFVANLSALKEKLERNEGARVELVEGPDDVCHACPHLNNSRCQKEGPGSEEMIRVRDGATLRMLGLTPGARLPWVVIMEKVRGSLDPADLEQLCRGCPWLSMGYCQEALTRLKTRDRRL
ncbi:MAG: DUF1284 domain-containing protein [candidate division NC10 bacterium]|nr:DUF1284 domain-containing protein [candidate division NC10 bacterium]